MNRSWPSGVNHIRVTASGEGRVYYSARAQYSSADEKLQKTGTVSINLLRDYFKLAQSKDGDKIVYDLEPTQWPGGSRRHRRGSTDCHRLRLEIPDGRRSHPLGHGIHRTR